MTVVLQVETIDDFFNEVAQVGVVSCRIWKGVKIKENVHQGVSVSKTYESHIEMAFSRNDRITKVKVILNVVRYVFDHDAKYLEVLYSNLDKVWEALNKRAHDSGFTALDRGRFVTPVDKELTICRAHNDQYLASLLDKMPKS